MVGNTERHEQKCEHTGAQSIKGWAKVAVDFLRTIEDAAGDQNGYPDRPAVGHTPTEQIRGIGAIQPRWKEGYYRFARQLCAPLGCPDRPALGRAAPTRRFRLFGSVQPGWKAGLNSLG